ncbi:alpha/beta fold hydrolase [Streptomyces sp. DSM 40750]|uniref:alpha/beta fold hydrolase n=1 Tax=Streptomyces sp. DSM 40750 TaxID=2801030 RepID=UPI00214BB699|nr:alpha/beta hydrolase [Streptomyces sp. DSM 40750]
MHGLGCSYRYWLPFACALALDARTVAVDLPGFGRTPGPPVNAGCARAVAGAGRLVAGHRPWPGAAGRELHRLSDRRGSGGARSRAGRAGGVERAHFRPARAVGLAAGRPPAARRTRERPGLGVALALSYADCGLPRAWRTFHHQLHDPVERKLRHLRTPVVVVRGSRDPVVPRAWAEEVTALLSRGSLAEVPGAGHTLNYSAPAELVRITRGLLTRAS